MEPPKGNNRAEGLASADVNTGEVRVMAGGEHALHQQLAQQEASELLWAAALDAERPAWCPERLRLAMASTPFSPAEAERTLQHYGLSSLDGLGLQGTLALQALGGLLRYLQDTQPRRRTAAFPGGAGDRAPRRCPVLDAQTRRNLGSPPATTNCRGRCSGPSIAP